ncbi:hypothetical protein EJ110_NYTH55670 [Nymphaea thermarum]|nr:hypothetical protein EJ110_NYTH55670 [Nymphaea thermarum]
MRLEQASLYTGCKMDCEAKFLSSRPHDIDEAVTMARCMEEDWARTHKDHYKKAGQHSHGGRTQVKHHHFAGRANPYERRDDRTFRQNRPNHSDATQGSVATLTSPRCPTCSRVHPEKPCYRVTGACLHCGGMGHFIKDCPIKRERELKKPEANHEVNQLGSKQVVEKFLNELRNFNESRPGFGPKHQTQVQSGLGICPARPNKGRGRAPVS